MKSADCSARSGRPADAVARQVVERHHQLAHRGLRLVRRDVEPANPFLRSRPGFAVGSVAGDRESLDSGARLGYRVSHIDHGLLTHFEPPCPWAVQIGNEAQNQRKGQGDRQNRERSARPGQSVVVAHRSQSEECNGIEDGPDSAGNPALQTYCHSLRVKVDHFVQRRDKQPASLAGVLVCDSNCLRSQQALQLFRPPRCLLNVSRSNGFQTNIYVFAEELTDFRALGFG